MEFSEHIWDKTSCISLYNFIPLSRGQIFRDQTLLWPKNIETYEITMDGANEGRGGGEGFINLSPRFLFIVL